MFKHCLAAPMAAALFFLAAPTLDAAPVTYSVTADALLHNRDGNWGGNLLVGTDQALNLTIAATYSDTPASSGPGVSFFFLIGLQVFDNTNNLASDLFSYPTGPYGGVEVTYSTSGGLDAFTGVAPGGPGGAVFPPVQGEFGEAGDPLPFGPAFDALVNANTVKIFARAPGVNNHVVGGGEGVTFQSGEFQFASSTPSDVPEPSTLTLFGLGLALVIRRRLKQ